MRPDRGSHSAGLKPARDGRLRRGVDAVLLSHDQHPDNLDDAGRRFLDQVPLVLSTSAAAERLGDVADHAGPIDIAIIFAGRARSPVMDAYLTFSSEQAAQAAEILETPTVIPIHLEGWQHLTQEPGAIPEAFARHGLTDRLLMLTAGETTTVAMKPSRSAET